MTAANTFVSGPLTADEDGNVYYNVIELNINGNPWDQNDVANAWLVKVTPDDAATTVPYAALVPNAPPGSSTNCPQHSSLLAMAARPYRGHRAQTPCLLLRYADRSVPE